MSRGAHPTHAQVLALMRHLADVAALKHDPCAQRQLLVDGLNELIDTDGGFFYVADEWRDGPAYRPHFTHHTLSTLNDDAFLRYTADFGIKFPLHHDPYCYHSIRSDDPLQAWTFDQVTSRRAAHHDNFMDLAATVRLQHGVVTFYRTGPDSNRIVGFGMHRFGRKRPLSRRQINLIRLAVEEVRQLIERGHLALPPLAPDTVNQLPPRLRQVLDRLLVGQTPKSIAFELGLSVWTVREHIQRLYAHFGVSGREELMARFVR